MKVAIRADASFAVGTGHVMRCLTLAQQLRGHGANVTFLCREQAGALCAHIEAQDFTVCRMPGAAVTTAESWQEDVAQSRAALQFLGTRPDWLVVDQPALDARWERALKPVVGRIFVIDDLADRQHDCDVLLDQNLHDAPEARYAGLVGPATRVFVGPRYALLRPEFDRIEARVRFELRRLLVFFGGTDPSNEALKLIGALRALGSEAPRTVIVLGPVNPHWRQLHRAARGMAGIAIVEATTEMARLMIDADLAIGTCGGSAWERCVAGLPTLVVINADNQRDDARLLDALGAVRTLGDAVATSCERWTAEIRACLQNAASLTRMSKAAAAVMQGRQEALRELQAALFE